MEKSGSAWRILGLGGGGAAALGGVELLLDGYGMFEEAVDALEVHTTVSHVLDGAAGVFHGVNGSLALLLPALHVRLGKKTTWIRQHLLQKKSSSQKKKNGSCSSLGIPRSWEAPRAPWNKDLLCV